MHDPVTENARVIDEVGAAATEGGVAIKGGRIAAIGKNPSSAKMHVDADRLYWRRVTSIRIPTSTRNSPGTVSPRRAQAPVSSNMVPRHLVVPQPQRWASRACTVTGSSHDS